MVPDLHYPSVNFFSFGTMPHHEGVFLSAGIRLTRIWLAKPKVKRIRAWEE